MARGALQVVGYRPVKLVAERLLDHVGDYRCDATELGVTEGVTGSLLGEKAAIGITCTFGYHHRAIAELVDLCLHCGNEAVVVEIDLGQQ